MAVEYEISSDVATIKGVASNTQVANIVKFYTGSITYDDEPTSKYASVTINGKTQRVMLCVAVSGTANYDDVPCLYSTVSGHRTLNVVAPTESGTPDDVPSLYETVVVDGKTVRALRCVLINATPNYDGVSSTCTFTDNGKTHTAQLINQVSSSSIETIVKGVSPLSLPDAVANSLQYVKAFGGTEQRNLPAEYTQVNYVTNTAQTAVNTGIMIDFAKNYEFEVDCRAVGGSWYILQSRETTNSNITGISGSQTGRTITLVVGNVTACQSAITRTVGNKLYVKATLNNGVATLYVKDETAGTEDTQTGSYGTEQPNPPTPVYLLGNAGEKYAQINSDIYMARIKENDTVVMDYVPARQVATAGFYDTVSGTFKTALTPANLVADGNTVPTPDTPMDIVSNNGVLKARHQSGLPLGYTLLDSVVFDSTQVIDTGFTPDNNSRIESKCYRTGSDCWFYGAGPSNPRITLYHSTTGTCRWGYQSRSNAGFVADTEYTIVEDKNGLNINGIDNPWTSGTAGDFTCDRSLTIGNNNGSTGTRYFAGNFYYMKIYNNGVLARDFVPCQNASNVVGLYDRVNGVFYTDTGLVAGNPVSDPIEIYTVGTVETIKDSLNNTATAEMLLKVGNYQDVQSIIDGVVTRNIRVKVLDGTEDWGLATAWGTHAFSLPRFDGGSGIVPLICSHNTDYAGSSIVSLNEQCTMRGGSFILSNNDYTNTSTTGFKQWLANQYAAGTPVIIVYPLATATTETVTGQTLQVTDGNNTLEITQASLSGLELEAKYSKSA